MELIGAKCKGLAGLLCAGCLEIEASYDDFRAGFAEEYSALDKSFERLTERERLIGTMISDQAQMPASGRGN